MKTTARVTLYLSGGDDTTKAVITTDGTGVNLWVGGICINASDALKFHELSKVAALAAQLQDSIDERKVQPHTFVLSSSIEATYRSLNMNPAHDLCSLCGKRREEHGGR